MKRLSGTNAEGRRILQRIGSIGPFIQASLSITKKRCGNPRCRCAQEGPVHDIALLTWKEDKKTCSLYVPIKLRKEVASWVEEGKRLKRLITQMSKTQRKFLSSMTRSRTRSKD